MKLFESPHQMDPDVADALYELSNVGVGKATTALGIMIDERIKIRTPQLRAVTTDITELLTGYTGKLPMGISMRLEDALGGAVLILLEQKFMVELVERVSGTRYTEAQLLENEDSLSVIQEVANIMAASYMSAISAYTGLRIYLTPIMVGTDVVETLIESTAEKLALHINSCICIDTSFIIEDADSESQSFEGNIVVLPDDASIGVLTRALL